MAQRRMLSLQIVDTDAFLEMPLSTQALYFHLVVRADDEGFVSNPNKIARTIGSNPDELKVLIAKRFILSFESGIVVIKHWLIHNTIRMDRFNSTLYSKERSSLILKENKSYTELRQPDDNQSVPTGMRKLIKDKLIKVNISKVNIAETSSAIIKPLDESLEIILDLLKDKQRHIQIIGLFARAKNIIFASREQQLSYIRRNLKSAQNLKAYKPERIAEVMKYLIDNADFKWTLETVGKYIDDDLETLNNNSIKTLHL